MASKPGSSHGAAGSSGRVSPATRMSNAYARGVRDSKQRLQELASRNLAERAPSEATAAEDVLPGIPSKNAAAEPQSVSHSRKSSRRHKSVDIASPPLLQPNSAGESPGKQSRNNHTRLRTRTIDEGDRGPRLSNLARRSRQPPGWAEEEEEDAPGNEPRGELLASPVLPQDASHIQSETGDRLAGQNALLPPENAISPESIRGTYLAPPSALFMKHLMRRTRGHMQGILLYRRDPSHNWTEAYCALNTRSASLLKENPHGEVAENRLVSDLRGCQVKSSYDASLRAPVLHLRVKNKSYIYQLLPLSISDFNAWFAALLCWQAVRSSKSLYADSDEAQLTPISAPASSDKQKAKEDRPTGKEAAVVKVGKMKLWIGDDEVQPAATEYRLHESDETSTDSLNWSTVSCILRENGELQILTATDIKVVAMVWLSKLSRSAVQRLCPSVLGIANTFVIYPQYAHAAECSSRLRPLYLCCKDRDLFETWFVLMRAFTVPELYGPVASKDADSLRSPEMLPGLSQSTASQLFRVERSLRLLVGEYRDKRSSRRSSFDADVELRSSQNGRLATSDYFVQVLVDGKIGAKTRPRSGAGETQWFEPLDLLDLPPTISSVTVQVRRLIVFHGETDEQTLRHRKSLTNLAQDEDKLAQKTIVGEVTIPFSESSEIGSANRRWLVMDESGRNSGDLSLQFQLDRDVILLDQEYSVLSELLHDLASDITLQIADATPPEKLSSMSDHLLNIFQASGAADDWLKALAEEEIDGIRRSGPAGRLRLNGTAQINESGDSLAPYGPPNDREGLMRDLTRATIAEANLLFRGNTLLSKALDSHMQRLGRDYLEETLGPKMREIAILDQDVEVDPSKISATASPQYNWHRLTELVKEVWASIRHSAERCPAELRAIFRHIRACADEKYGGRLKNIPYASVSGFLFLRFFCPAILNPFVFGLISDFPKPRAHRGFTLIAKTLQGLANQSTLGAKEPWLEPMNNFLNLHRKQLRDFIDEICSVPSDAQQPFAAQPYAVALSTFSRLPPACKEGTLSLPYLIDSSRSFAAIVNIWLSSSNYNPNDRPPDRELLHFHNVCLGLRQRTQDLFKRAERSEKRSSSLIEESSTIAARMESHPLEFWLDFPPQPKLRVKPADEGVDHSKEAADVPQTAADVGAQIERNKTPQRPSTSGGGGRNQETPKSYSRRFRSRSRSRTASPQRGGATTAAATVASPDGEDDADPSGSKSAKKGKLRDIHGRGLFGRKKKPDK